eukprot:7208900-Ditylum_brightwellii.AAC.1
MSLSMLKSHSSSTLSLFLAASLSKLNNKLVFDGQTESVSNSSLILTKKSLGMSEVEMEV